MNKITFPLARGRRGPAVADLQDGLLVLLAAGRMGTPGETADGLIARVYAERRQGAYADATGEGVATFRREQGLAREPEPHPGDEVDEATARRMNELLEQLRAFEPAAVEPEFAVGGRVEFEDGSPGRKLRIAIFDRDIRRRRDPLDPRGESTLTDESGVFPTVRFRRQNFAEGEGRRGPGADLVFEVMSPTDERRIEVAAIYRQQGDGARPAETRVPDPALGFEPAPNETLRIVVRGRPREDGHVEYRRLMRDLAPLLVDGTTPADFDQERFRDLDFAARETGWDREVLATVMTAGRLARMAPLDGPETTQTFYGLLRHGPPTEVAALPATFPELLDHHPHWRAKLEDSVAHRIVEGPVEEHLARLHALRGETATRVADTLAAAGVDERERRELLGAYHAHEGSIEEFWRSGIRQRLGWTEERVEEVQRALRFADLVGHDARLVRVLRDEGFVDPRGLARIDRGRWAELVGQVGPRPDAPGETLAERVARTADGIAGLVEATYPTEVLAHVAATSRDPQLAAARALLARFFEAESGREAGFDVRTSPVTAYLEEHADRVYRGLDRDERTLLAAQLKRLQRVFRLGVDREQTEALLALGFDSAFHLTRFSPEHFVAEFGERLGGADRAAMAYGRAESIAGTIVYAFADAWEGIHGVQPMAIRAASDPAKLPELKELPVYRELFGSLSLCDCGHCQSFYSPAAYFVDLLHMLDRPTLGPANPVEALFARRPDLAHIQLTCDNTDTRIPYIDLVAEVLESFVANRAPVAFNVPPPPPNQALPTPSAEELRVNPVYLTAASATFGDQAYDALQRAPSPLVLPLNLPLETTRVYLEHLGVDRADLMPLLDRDTGLEALIAQAAEALRLTPEEFEVLTGSTFGGASATWPATLEEMFGFSTADTPTENAKTLYNHVTPDFSLNPADPDRRSALIRSVQNILNLLTTPAFPVTGGYDAPTQKAVNAYRTSKGLLANGLTDDAFWGALDADGMSPLSVMLCPVPMFLDRSGLTYDELVGLVKSRFVNPPLQGQGDLDYLARLGIPAADVRAWIAAGFPALPAAIQAKLTAAGESTVDFTRWVQDRVGAVLVNTSLEAPCDVDRMTLVHLDGTLLSPAELRTLFAFARLWRKLGWKLEEMDLALEPGSLQGAAFFQTVLLLANLVQLRHRLEAPIADLISLYSRIPTHGSRSLYDRLFRNKAAQLLHPVFELNRERLELKAALGATPPAISDYAPALMAAFRVSAVDLEAIRDAVGLADDPLLPPAGRPRLDLAALSAIYRVVALARATELRIRELISLRDLSALDVFERPDRFPRGAALAFADLVAKVRGSGVGVAELEYLCRAVPRPPALPGAQREAWLGTLATLIDGLHALAAEEPIAGDPSGEQFLARLTSLLDAEDARAATALVYGRDVYTAPLASFPTAFVFPVAVKEKIAYDAPRKLLRYRGAMTGPERTALLVPIPGLAPAAQLAYERAVKSLAAQPRAFVARALKAMYTPAEAEALLIDKPSLDASGAPIAAAIDAKIADVLARRRAVLARSLIKQTLATDTGLAAEVVALLLEDEQVLTSLSGAGRALDDYQPLDGDGLDAVYFANPTLAGPPVVTRVDPAIVFDWTGAAPAPGVPGVGFSARWRGNLYAPAAGEISFRVRCSDGVRLRLDGGLVIDEWNDQPETEFSATARLEGGQFHPLEVEYYNQTGGAVLGLAWSSPSIPSAVIPRAHLHTDARIEALLERIERMYKLARLLGPFTPTANDVRVLAAHGEIDLDLLPLGGPAPLPVARQLFAQWTRLRDFAALRDRYPAAEVSLTDVLDAATPAEARERFVTLSGAGPATLDSVVAVLTVPIFDLPTATWGIDAPDLSLVASWTRIADVLALVDRTAATPEQLLVWARAREIEQLPTGPRTRWHTWTAVDEDGNDRRAENRRHAQESKDLVRARYDEERWREAARPLNDRLRERRRSTLVAFVLSMPEMIRARVTDTGRLFEYLLLDPEMEPCAEISRIKLGHLSVQHFTQRVLLDLESPLVPPSRIDRARWEWMKNYRVWEANRKVFLYPESYTLEPLRDNKTPIFLDLESDLLQDELNDPNAERAFRRYLERLDDVAKLTVCGTCIDPDTGALHVFGRTATTPFAYYHRRLDRPYGSNWTEGTWTPWRKVPVDLSPVEDGDDSGLQLLPFVWNRRLYLFWPLFERVPQEAENLTLPQGAEPIDCWRIRLAWSEYKDERWTPKQVGLPYLTSRSWLRIRKTPEYPDTESFHPEPFGPKEQWMGKYLMVDGEWVLMSTWKEPRPHVITAEEDEELAGVVLDQFGEWAVHNRQVDIVNVLSLMPKPAAHYLDAKVDGSGLAIRVFSRFKGTPKGRQFKTVTDTVIVVADGRRTDRKEVKQEEAAVTDVQQTLFRQVGTFHFPGCGADLSATGSTLDLKYESLSRPQDTINAFMGLRNDWPRSPGLRLVPGSPPALKFVPTPFDVIDSDNWSGFDRGGPFFYQDQQRCYLVTRESFRRFLDPGPKLVRPEYKVGEVERKLGLKALALGPVGIAPESPVRASAWALSGLARWAASTSTTAPAPLPMKTLSAPLIRKDVIVSALDHDLLESAALDARGVYLFTPHWHPYTCPLLAALNAGGLPGLFSLKNQGLTDMKPVIAPGGVPIGFATNFESVYKPDPALVAQPYPVEAIDFDRHAAYSIYHWEVFFHAPILVAASLSQAGKHEEAMRWFHFVFDPMTGDPAGDRRFWRFLPFRTADTTRIEDLLTLLSYTGTDPLKLKARAELLASIQEWMANPFRPHLIARRRPVAYMKSVFMQYLDNLIAWADELFTRDTLESIHEATQLYVLAANLLGERPRRVPPPGGVAPETYETLRGKLDALSNAQVDLETRLPFVQLSAPPAGAIGTLTKLPQVPYFCIPQNERLLGYWDTIADRLFKIRHCMNIEGVVRELPLFEPPIDPMLLVEAVAHGIDIGSVLNDLYAPLPKQRFSFMLQQALSACEEVRQLGASLDALLEKRDAEALALLRAEHESRLLEQVTTSKKLEIAEAEEARQVLENQVRAITMRLDYYEALLEQGLIAEETEQLDRLELANDRNNEAAVGEGIAQGLHVIPSFTHGLSTGGGWSGVTIGGSNLGPAASAVARSYSYLATSYAHKANRASITGSQVRRGQEWRFQREVARRELAQVDRERAAARLRKEVKQADLVTHEKAIEHARGVEELLRGKFTNDALYGWMERSLRTLYFQAYKSAYELARRAERCWRYERGTEATFVKFGAWDSSMRGLLAGERLYRQLKQMERAYHEQQVREMEIVKQVSVVQLDPLALVALKDTGSCEIEIPEWLFDLDYPGHYFRRLKTVAVSIPAVVGPYTSLSATLTLLSSKVRESSRVVGTYTDEENYRADHLPVDAIALSSGQADSGRFELDFRDPCYVPFEGGGAISRWRIELPGKFRAFDYDTIADVILQIKYTSRRDETLAAPALKALQDELDSVDGGALFRLFSLRYEFPNEWQKLSTSSTRTATFTVAKNRFPELVRGMTVNVDELHTVLILKVPHPTVSYKATLTPGGGAPLTLDWPGQPKRYRGATQAAAIPIVAAPELSGWQLQLTAPTTAADLDRIQDIVLVARYTAKP